MKKGDLKKFRLFREKYDQIVPIGEWCGTALWMRKTGLRGCSLPFDWIGVVAIENFVRLICTDFKGFFEKGNLKLVGASDDPVFGTMDYVDTATGMKINHDFPVGVPFDVAYPVARAHFDRRIARLYKRVNDAKKTLFIHFAREFPAPAESGLDCAQQLREKFSGKDLSFLVIENVPTENAVTIDELGPEIIHIHGRFFNKGDDPRYGNQVLGRTIFGAIRFKGKFRNLLYRKYNRIKFHIQTNCHLTHAARMAARTRLRVMTFNGDN